MARMKKQNENIKMNKLAKLKTRKGGLGKNEHPDGLTTYRGNSGKNRGNEKNSFPGGLKTRKGDPGKNGMMKKTNKNKHAKKHWPHMRYPNCARHQSTQQWKYQQKVLLSTSSRMGYSSLPSAMVSMRPSTTASPKGDFHKYLLEHEPLRAQYSNVLSTSAELCLQVVNHHALQSIHTCIIMHLMCSCIW